MTRTRSLVHPSLLRVLEDAPLDLLLTFLRQPDANFKKVAATFLENIGSIDDGDQGRSRKRTTETILALPTEDTEPVEHECQRVLLVSEGKGPTSLRTVSDQQLSHEQCETLDSQPDDLARSIWLHVNHRRVFDDAVSFRNARIWRDGKLFSAFEIDSDHAAGFNADAVPEDDLVAMIKDRLDLTRPCSASIIDLPATASHPPSVLVIIRHPGRLSSVAEHPDDGGRNLHYYLPQAEVMLIYTPALQRIEVCGESSAARKVVSESFASVALNHDVSEKPLTWANYDTSRFFRSLDLNAPEVPGFHVERAAVVEIEARFDAWHRRLRLTVPFADDIGEFAETQLGRSRSLQHAIGIARVVLSVRYIRDGTSEPLLLDITISDRNRCSLASNRDPELRAFGRKLLEAWEIIQPFRDLDPDEGREHLSVLTDLYDSGRNEVGAAYLLERGINPKRMLEAGLITRKGSEPKSSEEVIDPEADDFPSDTLLIYSIRKKWLEERMIELLSHVVTAPLSHKLSPHLHSIGTLRIEERDVPCYLARGLSDKGQFIDADLRLRANSDAGPGIVFTGQDPGWQFIGANMILPVGIGAADKAVNVPLDRSAIASAFKSSLGLILGRTAADLIVNDDGDLATLCIPGKPDLALFGEHSVRSFRILLDARKRGLPGVRTGKLIEGSGSTGIQQMLGKKRWPLFREYLESHGHGLWSLKM